MLSQAALDEALALLLLTAGVRDDLDADAVRQVELRSEDLLALWPLMSREGGSAGYDGFVSAVMDVCEAEWPEGSAGRDAFGLRLGKWRIDLAKAGIRSGLLTAIIASVLVERGMPELSIALVTAVLPTVLEIERIELSAKERMVLADLRLTQSAQRHWMREADLYASLPASARDTISPYDFADIVQRLRELGEIDEVGKFFFRVPPRPTR